MVDVTSRAKKIDRMEYKFRPGLIDAALTKNGQEHSIRVASTLKDINFNIILTSPLRRCLQTAKILFSQHPSKPKIEVWPLLRESFCSSCDVPGNFDDLLKEFPEFDFSVLMTSKEPHFWFLDSLENKEHREKIIEEIETKYPDEEDRKKKFPEFVAVRMKEKYPNFYETGFEVKERCNKVMTMLKERVQALDPSEKVAIVSHSAFLRRFTAKQLDENGESIDGIRLNNCEVIEFPFEI